MNPKNSGWLALIGLLFVSHLLAAQTVTAQTAIEEATPKERFQAALLGPLDVSAERIEQLKSEGFNAVVFPLSAERVRVCKAAADHVLRAGLQPYYWIEVGRCPALADAHPEWMASLQGHSQWRRLFPDFPQPSESQVVKNYPWVPILAKEPFDAQLIRVETLLSTLPPAAGIFLNDLQGSPSACGCGNTLCRWTSDYGKRRTTTPLGDDAAAKFVKAVQVLSPKSEVIPVWVTECEEHDGAHDGACAGVGCFKGICWKSYTAQLEPVGRASDRLAVLLPIREFGRELPVYGSKTGWIREALATFTEMPRKHERTPIPASRLIAVLQGWDMTDAEITAQTKATAEAGASGHVVAFEKIEQSWQPKIIEFR